MFVNLRKICMHAMHATYHRISLHARISYLQAKIQSSNSRCYITGDHHISLLNKEYTVEKSHVHYTFYGGYIIHACMFVNLRKICVHAMHGTYSD
jgi:hypothetical protein